MNTKNKKNNRKNTSFEWVFEMCIVKQGDVEDGREEDKGKKERRGYDNKETNREVDKEMGREGEKE